MEPLLEIITTEPAASNKKELQVKLFDVLDRLVNGVNFKLEVLTPTNLRTFIENFERISGVAD